jgi:glycosidase
MNNRSIDGDSPYFFGSIVSQEPIHYIRYYFKLSNAKETLYFTPWGIETDEPKKSFEYLYVNTLDLSEDLKPFHGQIGYHIFLDRFFNGGKTNDPKTIVPWESLPTRENVFGGDIEGLREKIPYLLDLGITVVFLLPIFKATSNHKYDTENYFEIDPSYGTMEEFKNLVRELHQNRIKIVLDGVFNHIGYFSNIFQDVVRLGKESKYFPWFYVHGDTIDTEKVNYECVGDYKWMPKLNYSSKEVREFVISIGQYWIKEADIDGWRLDVADEIDFTFWNEFRRALKPLKAMILVGETWKDGKDLLRGDQMDSIMNYKLRELIINFLTMESLTVKRLNNRIEKMLFEYPLVTHPALYNHLSSHDTERIINALHQNPNLRKLAVVMQMTLPGLPVVYYGDELGIDGENDPLCRKTMNWNLVDNEIHRFTKTMIRLRKSTLSLLHGDYKTVDIDTHVYSYFRILNGEAVLVLINRTDIDHPMAINPSDFFRTNNATGSEMNVVVPAQGFKLIQLTSDKEKVSANILSI